MRVLHVPYTYFPDAAGGTEVYVAALCAALMQRGIASSVAAPGAAETSYLHEGVAVDRFATTSKPSRAEAWGAPDLTAAAGFNAILQRTAPDIVHLHARTSAISPALAQLARARGAKVVLTYHSPTVSCARGTMLHRGIEPCDGKVIRTRCGGCVLEGLGLPHSLARAASSPPANWVSRRLPGPLRLPSHIGESCDGFFELLGRVDHVVAVCEWVRGVLLSNGVPGAKLTVCRQGVSGVGPQPRRARTPDGSLRVAYYGRNDPTKGVDLIVDAVLAAPSASMTLDLFLVGHEQRETVAALMARTDGDSRIRVRSALPQAEVSASMADYDLIAVPSLWMETGPLVVLEAQAAGVPVIGSNRGGVAELVRDGVDGILLPPGDRTAWTRELVALAGAPERLERLRAQLLPPRTMSEVGDEMAALYRWLGGKA